jgi:hypothetical protein
MGVKRNAYRILVGNAKGERHLGTPRRAREDSVRIYFRNTG